MSFADWWRSIRYGNEPVLVQAATRIFIDVVGADLVPHGFIEHDGMLLAPVSQDIRQIVRLMPLKGQSYCIAWGVSLSFVPHAWKSRIHWHRTESSARLDLFQAPAIGCAHSIAHLHSLQANGLNGEALFRKELARLWDGQRDEAFDWLARVATLDGVIAESANQANDPDNVHDPPPGLVAAFSLARAGDVAGGRQFLEQALEANGALLQPVDRLREAFEQVAVGIASSR